MTSAQVCHVANARLNILHVIPSISAVHGGPSTVLETMEKALVAAGMKITTATTDDDGPHRRLPRALIACDQAVATRFYARKWLEFYKVAPGMLPWLWRNLPNFDVVHVHALFSFTSLAASIVARLHRVPYIVRPLGTLASYSLEKRRPWLKKLSLWFLEGPMLRHAAAVHFTSQAEWDQAKALGISLRGRLVPLGVETSGARSGKKLSDIFPEVKERRGVLYLGRLDPKKNVEALLRAATRINWRSAEAVLLIAGDGEAAYVTNLKYLATELGIGDHVLWLGHIDGTRKANVLAGADLFILPSFSENFGVAVAEALLVGLPCVLSEGIGIASQVEAAGAALIVKPDPSDIARAVTILLTDESKRREMGINGRHFAEHEYSASAMAERLISLYREMAGSENADA